MRVIILAAGQGSRLRPYTNDRPKCMVALHGVPLLHRQLDTIKAAGITDTVVVGGYRSDRLELQDAQLVLNPRYAETNMVSTLFCAESWMDDEQDLLISYADIIYEPRVLQAVLQCQAPLCIAVDRQWRSFWQARMDDPLSDAETLRLQDGSRIVELGQKPRGYEDIQGQYMGLLKVRADKVAALRQVYHAMDRQAQYDGKDFDNMYMTSFLQYLIDAGWEARAAFTDNGWLEVDTAQDLEHFHRLQAEGSLQRFMRLED